MKNASPVLLKSEFPKVLLISALYLLLLPLICYAFVEFATPKQDALIINALYEKINDNPELSQEEKLQSKAFIQQIPPSVACRTHEQALSDYKLRACPVFQSMWQFNVAGNISGLSLFIGVFTLIALFVLSFRMVQYEKRYSRLFVSWKMLTTVFIFEVVAQGAILLWLLYWLPGFFFHVVSINLLYVAGGFVVAAVVYAIQQITRHPPDNHDIDGKLISLDDAPVLWSHVQMLAKRLKTPLPDQIIACTDRSFFATAETLKLGDGIYYGRTLVISLPILSQISSHEVDEILARQLAQLRYSKLSNHSRISTKLMQYDHFCRMLKIKGVNGGFYLMRLNRLVFEFSMSSDPVLTDYLARHNPDESISHIAISQIMTLSRRICRLPVDSSIFVTQSEHFCSTP
jgi:hypothetical protein